MDSDLLVYFLLFVLSYIANTFSALAGGGAGLIQFPVLIFLGLPFQVALATHKIASVALGVGATVRHMREGALDWLFAVFILACGIPGVVLGAVWVLEVPPRLGEVVLGLLTIALGFYSILSPELGQTAIRRNRHVWGYVLGGLGVFLIGILNGSITSGTGLFVTLLLVRWFGLNYRQAVTYTLILVGLFWNGSGALTLAWLGEVRWDWLPALILGSLLGGYTGAHLAIVKGNMLVKRSFEVITIAVGLSLLLL